VTVLKDKFGSKRRDFGRHRTAQRALVAFYEEQLARAKLTACCFRCT